MNTCSDISLSTPAIIQRRQQTPTKQPKFIAQFAHSQRAIKAAQKLRAETFSAEYGVQFHHAQGLDVDDFDNYCQHLNVYDTTTGKIIATTRLLSDKQAKLAGGYYSAQEFDLNNLLPKLQGRVLEIGRTCVHPDYRSGAAITVLWSALADYLLAEEFSYLIGCASISLDENGQRFHAIMASLDEENFIDPELRVVPKRAMPIPKLAVLETKVSLPPLLKAYLRMNAKIGGEACLDLDFNCADMFIVLDVATLAGRYAQRFLKTA
ncbi:GNAT family N-acetyltransferase [Agitococcus lubricus]|uniref:L-ornithine N(alpha)-acyltransferase n=1 Tax=Agitococcus lubricus TaxID=1077255 RepID=A0A2T5IYW9_9GAMM|nr:GNAT family N-acyltransferase [Agitococcus lubricus]PTQ89208.1 ornithine-acyl[acyl carrier protein] N-acyltransferase [Agitococcus lubricus]